MNRSRYGGGAAAPPAVRARAGPSVWPPIADLLQARVTGLVQLFAWLTFGLMLIGMALGFVVGLLPGLGGPTTLALMLPFVFKKTPGEAFAFLLALSLGGFAFVYGLFER